LPSQNNLLYFALSHLRATPYKVTYNLKILTGAFFSATMLGQRLGARKWFSLCVLMAGVSIVQLTKHETPKEDVGTDPLHVQDALEARGQLVGFVAVFAAAVTSGFCGVYQQRVLQDGGGNLWVRNAQMGLTSVVFGLGTVILKDMEAVAHDGFFQGYTPLVSVGPLEYV
jgi:UDP-sugar transporter A1/2/3